MKKNLVTFFATLHEQYFRYRISNNYRILQDKSTILDFLLFYFRKKLTIFQEFRIDKT